ncbi:LexA family protein [Rubrivirga sp.]|uniref:LexA family protein n=1 Tax=Rubrivirga sp. TaxID=1885344 RepID=UPI003B51CAFB
MSRRQLTQKQHSFLEYLREHVDRHKVWPTYREIADHFEYRSPNSVTQNLQALSRKGFLERGRNGYALVETGPRDGSIHLRGALRGGRIEPSPSDRLSLTTLFPDLTGFHALEIGPDVARTSELGEARYVFVSEGDAPEGETVVVVDGGRLSLGRIGADGCVECDEPTTSPEVLGRYAGHAGPYGIVRAQVEAQA